MSEWDDKSSETLREYRRSALWVIGVARGWLQQSEDTTDEFLSARLDIADRVSDILDLREQCARREAKDCRWGCTKARMNATPKQRADRDGCFFPHCYQPINPHNLPTGVKRYRSLPGERTYE